MSAINEAVEENKNRKAKQRKPEEDKKSTWEIDEEDLLDTRYLPFPVPVPFSFLFPFPSLPTYNWCLSVIIVVVSYPSIYLSIRSDYPFDEPDSQENIVYFDLKKLEPSTEYRPGDPPLIKGATLTKLLEKATPTEYAGNIYLPTYVLYHLYL